MDRASAFFRPGGTLEPGAESYIVRRADQELIEALEGGHYVFLLDSRQKGKSSLVARSIEKLRQAGIRPVKLDLQRIGSNVTPEQWYAGLIVGVGQELGLQTELIDYWRSRQDVGPLARFIGALKEVVLAQVQEPLVIFVDEVDFVRALGFSSDEFFAAIRECYNRRASDPLFNRLTFCLVGVATPGQLIRNPDISPFNIGSRIDLTDFALEELEKYAGALDAGRDGPTLIRRIHEWVSGHPYLTQLLCSRVASDRTISSPADVDRLIQELFFAPESRQKESNLADVERRMLNPDVQGMTPEESRIQVLQLYGRMLQAKGISVAEQNPIVATLRLSGVGIEEGGVLRVRNRVYRTIFDERWRQQNLPDSEVRRQRSAARKATVRAASLAAVLVVGLSAATLGALKLSNDRQQAVERLQQQSKVLEYQSYVGLMARLRLAMSEGRWQRVSSLIDSSRSNPLRGWEWGYAALSVTRHVAEPKVEAGRMIIEAVPGGNLTLFTPDTLYKFTPNGLQIEQSLPASNRFPKLRRGNLRVLEEEGTGALYFENALTHQVLGVSRTRHRFFDVDPKTQTFLGVLPGGNDAPFFILSLNGKVIQSFVGSTFPIAGRLLPDGTVLTVHQGGNIRRRDRTGKILASITMNDVEMGGWGKIALSSDGSQFVFLDSRYRRLEVRRCSDLNVVAQISGLRRTSSCSFSPNGQLLALGGTDGVLDVIDVKTGRVVDSLPGHRASISSVEFFDQGRFLASLDNAARIRIWPVGAKGSVQLYPEFEQEQASSAFLVREGKVLITTSSAWSGEPTLSSRNLNTGKLGRLAGWRSYKATDDVLYVTFLNGDVGLVDPDGLTVKARMRVFDEHIGEVFLCDSGKKLLVQRYRGQDAPGRYAILNATTLKVLSRINLDWPAGTRVQDQISVTPSGKLIAIAATVADVETQKRELSGVLHLVSTDDGRIVKRLQTEKPFRTILLEPNGGRILLASFASGAFPTTPTVLTVPELRSARALEESLIFDRMLLSPDGKVLAGFSAIGGVPSLWDYQSGKRIALLSPGVAIQSFTFSPDSLRVITGATNRTTTIWDGKTGEELFSLRYDPLRIDDQNGPAVSDTSVFSADGRQVIMACTDGCVRIFNSIPWKDQPKTAAKNGP